MINKQTENFSAVKNISFQWATANYLEILVHPKHREHPVIKLSQEICPSGPGAVPKPRFLCYEAKLAPKSAIIVRVAFVHEAKSRLLRKVQLRYEEDDLLQPALLALTDLLNYNSTLPAPGLTKSVADHPPAGGDGSAQLT